MCSCCVAPLSPTIVFLRTAYTAAHTTYTHSLIRIEWEGEKERKGTQQNIPHSLARSPLCRCVNKRGRGNRFSTSALFAATVETRTSFLARIWVSGIEEPTLNTLRLRCVHEPKCHDPLSISHNNWAEKNAKKMRYNLPKWKFTFYQNSNLDVDFILLSIWNPGIG